MSKIDKKMIYMQIRQCLPDTLSYSQKCEILEKLAEEYRKKSRKEVYADSKQPLKGEDYSPILKK